jgi:hypothetical protein
MKITFTSYETAFNRHIRLARLACKGQYGWERAEAVKHYFTEAGHPHSNFTFDQMAMNRYSDSSFPVELMKNMAYLCALNEEGYNIEGFQGRWFKEKLIGVSQVSDASVCLYSRYGPSTPHLLVVESKSKMSGYKTFKDIAEYDDFIQEVASDFDDSQFGLASSLIRLITR